jgi:hypothetical protein
MNRSPLEAFSANAVGAEENLDEVGPRAAASSSHIENDRRLFENGSASADFDALQ